MTDKDKKIIEDSEKAGIPIFVLTAKDMCSITTLEEYFDTCNRNNCNSNHLQGIINRMHEFARWQNNNSGKVKLPD